MEGGKEKCVLDRQDSSDGEIVTELIELIDHDKEEGERSLKGWKENLEIYRTADLLGEDSPAKEITAEGRAIELTQYESSNGKSVVIAEQESMDNLSDGDKIPKATICPDCGKSFSNSSHLHRRAHVRRGETLALVEGWDIAGMEDAGEQGVEGGVDGMWQSNGMGIMEQEWQEEESLRQQWEEEGDQTKRPNWQDGADQSAEKRLLDGGGESRRPGWERGMEEAGRVEWQEDEDEGVEQSLQADGANGMRLECHDDDDGDGERAEEDPQNEDPNGVRLECQDDNDDGNAEEGLQGSGDRGSRQACWEKDVEQGGAERGSREEWDACAADESVRPQAEWQDSGEDGERRSRQGEEEEEEDSSEGESWRPDCQGEEEEGILALK
uniref:Uncharacterized protein n=1 Tax=Sphaerodactylus townsendi TaxID=933632 RepID=A0ACB8EWV6_9SAUR